MIRFGVEYTCDRCGHKEFLDLGFADKAYWQLNAIYDYKYKHPEGWGKADGKLLCPTCFKLYGQRMDEFMKEEK